MKRGTFLHKKASVLNKRPLLVGTLLGGVSLSPQIKKARSPYVDLVEIRLDSFKDQSFSNIRSLKRKLKKPLLLTFRARSEGGAGKSLNNKEREKILEPLLALGVMLDVEIRQRDFAKTMTKRAHKKGLNVIHSMHNFSGPGSLSQFKKLHQTSRRLKGDLFKVAMTPQNDRQMNRFLLFGKDLHQPEPVLIAMKKRGLPSRFIGFSFGSRLTYGHLGTQAAPGQVSVKELSHGLRSIYTAH